MLYCFNKLLTVVLFLTVFLIMSCTNSGDEMKNEINTGSLDTVIIKGMAFVPAELFVQKGDTVIWINEDIVPHDVAAFPGNEWASDTLAVYQTWKKVIEVDEDYFCNIHPSMKGKVLLEK